MAKLKSNKTKANPRTPKYINNFKESVVKGFKSVPLISRADIRHLVFALAILVQLAGILWLSSFLTPRTIEINFAHTNCFFNPLLLPNLLRQQPSQSFKADIVTGMSIAGYPIYSQTTCATVTNPPKPNTSETVILSAHSGLPIKQTLNFNTSDLPQATVNNSGGYVSIKDPLVFRLDQADSVFNYELAVRDEEVACAHHRSQLLCNLERMKLKQSKSYTFVLNRMFDQQLVESVLSQKLTTVEPIVIRKSSVKNGSTIYDKAQQITITANKPISSAAGLELKNTSDKGPAQNVGVTYEVKGKQLIVRFNEPLKRQANFKLTIRDLQAADRGFLVKPYELSFKTSGGPKATDTNIGTYGASTYINPLVVFDYAPSSKQNLNKLIWLEIDGQKVSASVSLSGKYVYITPVQSLPGCTRFKLLISEGLQNKHGISGGAGQSFSSRTLCQDQYSVGSSVQGRSIIAYSFGSGASRIILIGATHGDEPSSMYALNSFVDNLEANFDNIPKNRTVIVIPSINPDGIAAGSRVNARSVDLNRNFPANNWKKDVVMPGGQLLKNGGGKTPLSEPESSSVADFVLGQNPDLVLTYHAVGSLVIANESGNSMSLATQYGNLTGFTALGNSQIGGIFTHDTTGAFEDWLHDKYGIPALLVELSSYGGNEFWTQSDAMWAMVSY